MNPPHAVPSLHRAAAQCVAAADLETKLRLSEAAVSEFRAGRLTICPATEPDAIGAPGRPPRPRLVAPRQLPARGLGSAQGRAALLHAVAHIELNAIDLAWDAVYRFRDMPQAYYADWVAVAADETRHFTLLRQRLHGMGYAYGDFDAHNGLWEMAMRTADSCLARMALVPRVLEARGLDVTPGMIGRLRGAGDHESVAILELILREEVAHVAAGSRWFAWCCAREGREPQATFEALLAGLSPGAIKAPLNLPARREAGFSETELDVLQARTELRA